MCCTCAPPRQESLQGLEDWLAEHEMAFIGGDAPNATGACRQLCRWHPAQNQSPQVCSMRTECTARLARGAPATCAVPGAPAGRMRLAWCSKCSQAGARGIYHQLAHVQRPDMMAAGSRMAAHGSLAGFWTSRTLPCSTPFRSSRQHFDSRGVFVVPASCRLLPCGPPGARLPGQTGAARQVWAWCWCPPPTG